MSKHHVHPETYNAGDSLEWRTDAVHKAKWQCEMTWCTFADLWPEYQERYVNEAKALKAELKKAAATTL